MSDNTFRDKLTELINCHSKENGSNTPDFILATFLEGCLKTFDEAVLARENWYGRNATVISGGDGPAPIPVDPKEFTEIIQIPYKNENNV